VTRGERQGAEIVTRLPAGRGLHSVLPVGLYFQIVFVAHPDAINGETHLGLLLEYLAERQLDLLIVDDVRVNRPLFAVWRLAVVQKLDKKWRDCFAMFRHFVNLWNTCAGPLPGAFMLSRCFYKLHNILDELRWVLPP